MNTIKRSNVSGILAALVLFAGAAALNNACSSDDAPAGTGGSGGTSILGDASPDRGTGGSSGAGGSAGMDGLSPTDAPVEAGDSGGDVDISDTATEACTPETSDAGCFSACAPNTDLGFLNACNTCAFTYDNGPLDVAGGLPALP